jgi:hypothetical protein
VAAEVQVIAARESVHTARDPAILQVEIRDGQGYARRLRDLLVEDFQFFTIMGLMRQLSVGPTCKCQCSPI